MSDHIGKVAAMLMRHFQPKAFERLISKPTGFWLPVNRPLECGGHMCDDCAPDGCFRIMGHDSPDEALTPDDRPKEGK